MGLTKVSWRKSSYSDANGGNCIEIAAIPVDVEWRKATYSAGNGGDCVELAAVPGVIAVRDSKNPEGGVLMLSPGSFRAFVDGIRVSAWPLS